MITVHDRLTVGLPQTNGFGPISPTSCKVSESLNGGWNLTMVHPKDEFGKWRRLQNGRLLYVPTPYGLQLFRIKTVKKSTVDGILTVTAKHIFYDLLGNKILDSRPTEKTGNEALQIALAGLQFNSGFAASSDITTISTAYWIDKNPVKAFISDDDNSFISRWGGEIRRNNYSFAINSRIGSDTGRIIRYGKDLEGVDATEDETDLYTRLRLSGRDTDDSKIYLEENDGFVDSPYISTYGVIIGEADCGDVKVGEVAEDGTVPYPDIVSVRAELLRRTNLLFEKGADKPSFSLEVNFTELGKTEEYREYVNLQPLLLGNGLTVKYSEYDIDYSLRMTAYEYDAIAEEYIRITLGDTQPSIGQKVVESDIDISILKDDVSGAVKVGKNYYGVELNHSDGLKVTGANDLNGIQAVFNSDVQGWLDAQGNFIGGMALINSIVSMVAGVLTNNIESDFWATVGDVTIEGYPYTGILGYLKSYSTTMPIFKIVTRYVSANGLKYLIIEVTGVRIWISNYGSDYTRGSVTFSFGNLSFYASALSTSNGMIYLRSNNSDSRQRMIFADQDNVYMSFDHSTGERRFGIDDTGIYTMKNGTKTYL